MIRPMRMKVTGATPVETWINLVKKWNSCDGYEQNERVHQRMMITKGEALQLVNQYPKLYEELKIIYGYNYFQREMLSYCDYVFEFKFPEGLIKPIEINGITLLD